MEHRRLDPPDLFSDGPEDTGPTILHCPPFQLPDRIHGFATRRGGVSSGSFSTLNFGLKGGDRPENVQRNSELLTARLGLEPGRLFRVQQVHGCRVYQVDQGATPQQVFSQQADALISNVPGHGLGVVTADCVPVLLAAVSRPAIAAVHAGWRGLVAGVLPATVAALAKNYGCSADDLRVAIGPAIGVCCFQVGDEVADQFSAIPGSTHCPVGDRPHVNLRVAAAWSLIQCGVRPEAISQLDLCTRCRADLLFSYRRDAAATGLQMSVVGLRADL